MKYILVLSGPMCSGKTTISKLLMAEGFVRVSSDALKWNIGNYSVENESHRILAKDAAYSFAETAITHGFPVVVDGSDVAYQEKYKMLAQEYGYTCVFVTVEGPLEVLRKRFLERVARAEAEGNKRISVTDIEGFKKRYDAYMTTRGGEGVVFDSSLLGPQEIAGEIAKIFT